MQPKISGKRPKITVVPSSSADLKVSKVKIHQKVEKLCAFEMVLPVINLAWYW
jgi:hypothetical protein